MKSQLSILLCFLLSPLLSFTQQGHKSASAGNMVVIEGSYPRGVIDGYNLYLPKSYPSGQTAYPVLIYLCGGSSVGGEIDIVKRWPIPKLLVEETDMSLERNQYALDSFIVVSPHMRGGNFDDRQWYQNDEAIKEILAEVLEKYEGDANRIYITGLSRGGHGTWGLLSNMGEYFAAAVPIAGGIHGIESYEKMLELPLWVVHNEEDNRVGSRGSVQAVEKLEDLTGKEFLLLKTETGAGSAYLSHDRIFSFIPKEGHDAWTPMYESVEFYKWLLKHKKGK